MSIQITSTAFAEGGSIPSQYACDGVNVSLPLAWTGIPEGTKSLALIGDDPDAPSRVFVHWVVYNLPPGTTSLPEGIPASEAVPGGGIQGKNDFGRIGYGGPCPPRGTTHRYFFKLYALNVELTLPPGASKTDVLRAMEGHILAEGQLMGTYKRK